MASSIPPSSSDEEWYAYRFDFQDRQFLFVRNLGAGIESVAQLVVDVHTGERLVRKVAAKRCIGLLDKKKNNSTDSNTDETTTTEATETKELSALGLKPNEFQVLDAIQRNFTAPKPGLLCNLVECYGHEYLPSGHTTKDGRTKTYSVSYWKLYNGESVNSRWVDVDRPPIDDVEAPTTERDETITAPPISIIARMLRQVLSTLHYMHTAGPRPLLHHDTHFGNIWIHWPETSPKNNNKAKADDNKTEADDDKTKVDDDKAKTNADTSKTDNDEAKADDNADKKTNNKTDKNPNNKKAKSKKPEFRLPEFYLGDLGVASYLAEPHQTRIERPLHFFADAREPLRDLSIIRGNLAASTRTLFIRAYHSDGFDHAANLRNFLEHVLDAMSDVMSAWIDANVHLSPREQRKAQRKRQKTGDFADKEEAQVKEDAPPPAMEALIQLVRYYERMYGRGGKKDETKGKGYKRFMKAERAKAMEVGKERAFRVKSSTMMGRQHGEALFENKTGPELRPLLRDNITMPIHGPWQLVTLDGRPAEGPGTIWHHRPAMATLHDGNHRREAAQRERDEDETDWSTSDPLDFLDNEKLAEECLAGPLPHGVDAPATPPQVPRVLVSLAPSSREKSLNNADKMGTNSAAAGMSEVKIWRPAVNTEPGKISWADIEDSDEEDIPVTPSPAQIAETPGQILETISEETPESEAASNPNPPACSPEAQESEQSPKQKEEHDSPSSNQESSPGDKSSTAESSPATPTGSPNLPRFVAPPGFAIRPRANTKNLVSDDTEIAAAKGMRRPGRHWVCPDIVRGEGSE